MDSFEEIFHLHADFCKMLASPKKLRILALLSREEKSVGELADSMDTAMATANQHLIALRGKHIAAA